MRKALVPLAALAAPLAVVAAASADSTAVSPASLTTSDWRTLTLLTEQAIGVRPTPAVVPVRSLARLGYVSIDRVFRGGGRSFYTLSRLDGTTCYGQGPAHVSRPAPLLAGARCPGAAYPSRAEPVLDLSTVAPHRGGGLVVSRLMGFASPRVATVGVVATGGGLEYSTPVRDGVYVVAGPRAAAAARIVALDASGRVVYRKCLPGGC
jgi:hypothetical protein